MYIHRSCKNKCMLFLGNSKLMFRDAVKSKKLFFRLYGFPKNYFTILLHLEKRSFEPFKITFLEIALYFINVLTKRNNLSYSEAIFICQFPQNMKVGVAGHTFFEKSNEVNFLNSRAIISFHTKSLVI